MGGSVELAGLVADFADAMGTVDRECDPACSARSERVYKPGIGPYGEAKAVEMVGVQMRIRWPDRYSDLRTGVSYPGERKTCDLALGPGPDWVVEVKMARFWGDNGKPDDTAIKDLLSPYPQDRSALTDCLKLAAAAFRGRKAILIYGFENETRSLDPAIEAFEALASRLVTLGPREGAPLGELVHPVHSGGRVFAWEVSPRG